MTRRQILYQAETEAAKSGLQEPAAYTSGDIFPKSFMTAWTDGERKQVSGAYMPNELLAIYTEKNRKAT